MNPSPLGWIDGSLEALLVGVGVWYAVETRRLRTEAQRQVRALTEQLSAQRQQTAEMRQQTLLSVKPLLVPYALRTTEFLTTVKADAALTPVEKDSAVTLFQSAGAMSQWSILVRNEGDRIGTQVGVTLFDAGRQMCQVGTYGCEFIKPGHGVYFTLKAAEEQSSESRSHLVSSTGISDAVAQAILPVVGGGTRVIVTFSDTLGTHHIAYREFLVDADGVVQFRQMRIIDAGWGGARTM